jgi:hypothetical protein
MSKGYTIVETSKMSLEYDGSLINVEKQASTALENGRLVAIDATNGNVRYAKTADSKVYLLFNVEKMYDETLGLGDFRVEAGDYCRIGGFRAGDEFKTSAISGTLVKGDKVILETDTGKLIKSATPAGTENFIAEVIEVGSLGFQSVSFGLNDNQTAVVVRVIKG